MAKVTFGTWTENVRAPWRGDYTDREHLLPGGARLDPAQFRRMDAVVVTTTGVAAIAATSIPVAALSGAIPSGTILDFTGAGEFALLTAAAAAGATSLTVEALDAAIESGDTAVFAGTRVKWVQSGTLVGRTIAERDAGTGYGPAVGADDEIYLLAFDVEDADNNPECVLYRHTSLVKENFLPAASRDATNLPLVRARYQTTRGTD